MTTHPPSTPSWRFVDGKSPGDGAAWLNQPDRLWGFIDVRSGWDDQVRRVMVVARSYVDAKLNQPNAKYAIFATMLVVHDGTPDQMRASIDAAVTSGTLSNALHR